MNCGTYCWDTGSSIYGILYSTVSQETWFAYHFSLFKHSWEISFHKLIWYHLSFTGKKGTIFWLTLALFCFVLFFLFYLTTKQIRLACLGIATIRERHKHGHWTLIYFGGPQLGGSHGICVCVWGGVLNIRTTKIRN